MNYNRIQNLNQRQFDIVMKREGISVIDYFYKDITYDIFIRRNNRSNSPQGKLRIFYEQSTPIGLGTIFVLNGECYLVTSQDGIESNVYYTSIATRCDCTFNVLHNGNQYVTVPCVTISDKYTLSNNSTISIISGSVVIMTGLNDYAKSMGIGDGYYAYGGYYKVGNFFYNDGLAYVYMTREATSTDNGYSLTYNGDTSFDMSIVDTYQLSYTATDNNGLVVESPALTYASSNTSVATVDGNGLITFIGAGSTNITTTWVDGGNVTCTTTITVTANGEEGNGEDETPTETVVTLAISGNSNLRVGFSRTYTATYTDQDSNDVSADYTTTFSLASDDMDISAISTEQDGHAITLLVDNEDLVDCTFTLTATSNDAAISPANIEVTIVGLI